jgi:bifunctional non-homologous end joining protein LigD
VTQGAPFEPTMKAKRLTEYTKKRDFSKTPEPRPGARSRARAAGAPSFMVHKHDASRLHYDLRLEIEGALASWAIPKGPSYDPGQKRLAVQTEDHPLEYGGFEGRIPDDEYGGGDSLIWDRGSYETVPTGEAPAQRKKGHLTLELHGDKLRGRWHLVRTQGRGEKRPSWLFFKARDEVADPSYDVISARPESVVSGRVMTRGPERASVRRAVHPPPDKLLAKFLPPMLATLVSRPPDDRAAWIHELKYDGFRALAALSRGRVAVWSRNGHDLAPRFPGISPALGELAVTEAVIDGEIVVPDAGGAPRFELIQRGATEGAMFVAFDLLELDGRDLRGEPLETRRDLLESVLSNAPEKVVLAERVHAPAEAALQQARDRGFEGIVAKRRGSVYEGSRSRAWLKLKALSGQEFAIVGFEPSAASSKMIGALLLAVAEKREGEPRLVFAGKVGTGFTHAQRTHLRKILAPDAVAAPEVLGAPRIRAAVWVRPRLVGEVRFTEWTSDGRLRHPSFAGLRPDKAPLECVRERASAPPEPGSVRVSADARPAPREVERPALTRWSSKRDDAAPVVTLTHPAKIIYPRDGFTKADVAAYFDSVAAPLLGALADRPLSLEFWRSGIDRPAVFQQSVARNRPPWMRVIPTPARTKAGEVLHPAADRPETMRWFAQHTALTIHAWASREGSLEEPDWMLLDLDPAEGEGIEQAVRAALVLRKVFDDLGLPSVVKTSGKRGLHVLVPLAAGHSFEQVQRFALELGRGLEKLVPELTLERSLAKRRGRLYLDCLQNAYGKTVAAPYTLRAADGAPVSAPLHWSEVTKRLDPARYNLKTMRKRLDQVGDLFAEGLRTRVKLPTLR